LLGALIKKKPLALQETVLVFDGVEITDPKVIVHEFSKYFVNIGTDLASKTL